MSGIKENIDLFFISAQIIDSKLFFSDKVLGTPPTTAASIFLFLRILRAFSAYFLKILL